jgi:lysophospholipase L1-like esterase
MLLNVTLLFVAVNVVLCIAYAMLETRPNATGPAESGGEHGMHGGFAASGAPLASPRRSSYQLEWFDLAAYGTPADANEASRVLDDFYSLAALGFAYQPWVQFVEPRYDGERVHVDVDARGFAYRRTSNPLRTAAGPAVQVFALGGSTTFGYNVADEHTWPSWLAAILDRSLERAGVSAGVEVTNWGRGYFYPTQEVALLADLLRSGYRPDVVIFMDGVNLGPAADVPHFTQEVAEGFRQLQFGLPRGDLGALERLPMVRFARSVAHRFAPPAATGVRPATRDVDQLAQRFHFSWTHARLLCRAYAIECAFFLQPDPVLNYPLALYRRPPPASFASERRERERLHDRLTPLGDVVDLTGLFERFGAARKAIIDDVHYSPAFNRFVAEAVARNVEAAVLARARAPARPGPSTGTPRSFPGARE